MISIFDEKDFETKMKTEVNMFLSNDIKDDYVVNKEQMKLHVTYALHPEEKAAIVFSHGFCEFFGKYHEIAYYFYELGFSIFFLDHRGHGWSERILDNLEMVHIRKYDDYVEDFKCFMDTFVVSKSSSKEYYLFAHSMGGAVGALFLEKYPMYFKKAILSSPLLGFQFGNVPEVLVTISLLVNKMMKKGEQYAKGQHGFDPTRNYEDSSSMSKARFDYVMDLRKKYPECQTSGGSNGWFFASIKAYKKAVRNAKKVQIPVLLFQAGKDRLVSPKGQDLFAKRAENTSKIVFPQSKHEIFNATDTIREKYYQIVFSFFG